MRSARPSAGPRELGHALAPHYSTGLPLGKAAEVTAMTGSSLMQSAVVNTADTGWRVNTTLAFMMGFFTGDTANYQIRSRHRHQEVFEVIGPVFGGKIGTCRGKSYEARALDKIAMQKCLSHLLKNLSTVEAGKTGSAREFTTQLKALLREGLSLWQQHQSQQVDLETCQQRGKPIDEKLDHQLRRRILRDADNARLLKGIGRQHERGRLTLLLHEPEIGPSNNRAERGLRPAVIARKVSQCSKNERGATAYATLRSLFGTLRLRTKDASAPLSPS